MAYNNRRGINGTIRAGANVSANISAGTGSDTKTFAPTYLIPKISEATSAEYIVGYDNAANSEGEPQLIKEFRGQGNKGLGVADADAKVLGLCNTGNTVLEIMMRMMTYDDNSGADRVGNAGSDSTLLKEPYVSFLMNPGAFTVLPTTRFVIYNEDQTTAPTPEAAGYGTAVTNTFTGTGDTSGDPGATNGQGKLIGEGGDWWGLTSTGGLVPGSISVNFYAAGYQEFGITGRVNAGKRQTSSTDTGLNANTAYRFKCTVDGTANNIVFTTDASDTTWGNGVTGNGVLKKINDRFHAAWKSGTVVAHPKIHIVNGEVRVTSGTRYNTSAIALADSTTGSETQMFGTNGMPHEGSLPSAVAAALETTSLLNRPADNTNHLLIDKGDGTGTRVDGGTFRIEATDGQNYNLSGNKFIMENCPPYANFKITYNCNAAHSGPTLANGVADNMISKIYARSVNPDADGKVKIYSIY